VYRVFEALDELGAIVEEARGVPMTAGCVVPRGDVLELIDDIKDAMPGELDDAQDVLDARDQMLNEAKDHSGSMVATANAEADSMINHARAEADRLLAVA
jgi:cell division septum initiation protein DivIVA